MLDKTHGLALVLSAGSLMLSACGPEGAAEPPPAAEAAQPTDAEMPGAYSLPGSPYASVAQEAREQYVGSLEPSELTTDNAGYWLSLLLYGPLESMARSDSPIPRVAYQYYNYFDDVRRNYLAVKSGFPAAVLSATAIGGVPVQTDYELRDNDSRPTAAWFTLFDRQAGSEDCPWGGTQTWSDPRAITGFPGIEERSITWEDCQVDGAALTGTARVSRTPLDAFHSAYAVAWDNVTVENDKGAYRVKGVDSWPYGVACEIVRPRHTYVHVQSLSDGHSVLYENLYSSLLGSKGTTRMCAADGLFANYWEGRILDSADGAIRISTPAHLAQETFSQYYRGIAAPYAANTRFSAADKGLVTLAGREDSEVQLRLESFSRFSDLVGTPGYRIPYKDIARVVVRSGNRPPTTLRFDLDDVWQGVLGNLADTDGDGASNFWETIHEYDPADGSDGAEDEDGDSMSAAEEQRLATSPSTPESFERFADEVMTASFTTRGAGSYSPQYLQSNPQYWLLDPDHRGTLTVAVPPIRTDIRPERHHFTLALTGSATFLSASSSRVQARSGRYYYPSTTCALAMSGHSLTCDLAAQSQCAGFSSRSGYSSCVTSGIYTMKFEIIDPANGPFSITATLHPGELDNNSDNDRVIIEHEPLP